jgi:hypothetical protein
MDVEYTHVRYPTENSEKTFNFPSIFSSIFWGGSRLGVITDINIFQLPCHFCDVTCEDFESHYLKFDCLIAGHQFINRQISLIEKMLATFEGLKIFSYGKSDIFQLEQGSNFFSNSFEHKEFERRNRKLKKRLTEISLDLAEPQASLEEIENKYLKNWIPGWSREKHLKINKRIMTKKGSPNWESNYYDALKTCMRDTISAFYFLLYKNYKLEQEEKPPIGLDRWF